MAAYHAGDGDGLEDLVDDDPSVEDIGVVLSLEAELLAVVALVGDGQVGLEVVGSNVDQVDSGVGLVVGVVEDEEQVVSDSRTRWE